MLEIGQTLAGKYTIVRLIGRGGMGEVYEGRNRLIDRRVAIKILLPSADPHAVRRFEQEARAAGRIGNDHILEILDLGTTEDGSYFMVAEFLDGESFDERLSRRGRLSPEEVAPLMLQLLSGLAAAHDAGIFHRDLKPDNVFILREKAGRTDFVKIIDFGISKFSSGEGSSMTMTRTGSLMGTPYFMAPEQARGAAGVDHRADIYAVGVMLYKAVSGELPYQSDSLNDLLFKIALEDAPPLEALVPGLDPDFIALINRAMARDLERRYGSARELAEALKQWCQRPSLAGTNSSGAFNVDGAAAQVGLFGAARERSSVSALEVPGELGAASRGRRTAPLVAAGRTVPTPGPFSGTSPDVTAFPGEPTARGRQARLAALLCVVAAFVGLGSWLLSSVSPAGERRARASDEAPEESDGAPEGPSLATSAREGDRDAQELAGPRPPDPAVPQATAARPIDRSAPVVAQARAPREGVDPASVSREAGPGAADARPTKKSVASAPVRQASPRPSQTAQRPAPRPVPAPASVRPKPTPSSSAQPSKTETTGFNFGY